MPGFAALLGLFVALYVWRMSGLLALEPVTDHLSNLYLSGAAVAVVIGPAGARDGRRWRLGLATGAGLVALNLVLEVLVPAIGIEGEVNEALGNVNTSDPLDGLFGLAGVALALVVLHRTPRSSGHGDLGDLIP